MATRQSPAPTRPPIHPSSFRLHPSLAASQSPIPRGFARPPIHPSSFRLHPSLLLLLPLLAATTAPAATPVVSDVSYEVRGNEFITLVDITFTITDEDGDMCWIDLWGHDDAVDTSGSNAATKPVWYEIRTFARPWEQRFIEDTQFPPGTHTLTWVASADVDDRAPIEAEQFQIYVRASDEGRIAPGDYMIIDVSGGPNATEYPVEYRHVVPVHLDEYKTDKIVLRELPDGNWMGVYEVTQRQYELVTGQTPSHFGGNPMRPVETVSWNDIMNTFMPPLRTKTGMDPFNLPEEGPWETAARAGTTADYADYTAGATLGGSSEDSLRAMGWYSNNSGSRTHNAGSKRPNAWGLHDHHGNVWEWTATASGSSRIVRGGSWSSVASFCRSSYWYDDYPSNRYSVIGFRLAFPPGQMGKQGEQAAAPEASRARRSRDGAERQGPLQESVAVGSGAFGWGPGARPLATE